MRNFNDITQNKASGKTSFSVSGTQHNGAFHSLGEFDSTSKRGAIQQAKNIYGDRYKSYFAGLAV